jgi:hypothetical protein
MKLLFGFGFFCLVAVSLLSYMAATWPKSRKISNERLKALAAKKSSSTRVA